MHAPFRRPSDTARLQRDAPRGGARRRVLAAAAAATLGLGLALAGATAANAVAVNISIQATSPTTQPSGSDFTYQINLACAGTNAPTCNDAVVTIPLDSVAGMTGWNPKVTGGPSGFIASQTVDPVAKTLVVTLNNSIQAGSSQSIILSLTPPNLTTPDGTSWSLLPSVASPDPAMTGTSAPVAATGTATATVPLTVSKTSDGTFYKAGETITYMLRATCPSSMPLGSIYATDMTVTDDLPAGLTFVSSTPVPTTIGAAGELTWTYPDAASVPVACGGTAPGAAPDTITVLAKVGTVGPAGSDFHPYENVPNTVTASANPMGGGTAATASGTRTVVLLAGSDPAIPGQHGLGKSSAAPLNRAPSGTPDRRATYPGRWLPNGDNTGRPASVLDEAPATYTIAPRIQYESFQYEIHDKLPCLADRSVDGVYTQSAGTCAAPAFHVLGVRIDYSGAAPGAGYAPQYLDVAGVTHDLVFETSGSNWAGWVVPTADLGRVAELVIPRDVSQQARLADNIRVYGYADSSTTAGEVLQNQANIAWYLGTATTTVDAQVSPTADVFILDSPQIGISKTMTDVGAATGRQAHVALAATLFAPGLPSADLVVADLLPAGTSLVTDPTTITAQLTRPGGSTVALTGAQLHVEVVDDYAPGRDLVRVTLRKADIPAEAGKYTLTLSQLTVLKPASPGVYTNTARVYYDDPALLPSCAAGEYDPSDGDNLRADPADIPANCFASATFRTVTSTSGQFQLDKTVQGDYDASPQAFPAVGHVKLTSGTADYTLSWTNTGAPNLRAVALYDVLPHVGDVGVSGAQATDARGSQFRPVLAAVGVMPAGVTIAYSASADACRPEVYPSQGPCVNDWTTDPGTLGGFANVMAIRLSSTVDYATGEGLSVAFQMSVPTVSRDQIAWNSVAAFARTAAGIDLLPTESPKVGITASDDRLSLAKVVDAASAVPGDTLTYRLTVGNVGTRDSAPTVVHDVLPAGLTFVGASAGGAYDGGTRTITWSIPAIHRDDDLTLVVTATVDSQQDDAEIVNSATLVNPRGYSPPVIVDPCTSHPDAACARTTVPPSPALLGFTGSELPIASGVIGLSALLAGVVLVVARRRATR